MKKLLTILNNSDVVIRSKIGWKHCENLNCLHIDDAVAQGFAFLSNGRVAITKSGKDELLRLNTPAPYVPTKKENRVAELKIKLADGTITDVEVKEFLKLLHT